MPSQHTPQQQLVSREGAKDSRWHVLRVFAPSRLRVTLNSAARCMPSWSEWRAFDLVRASPGLQVLSDLCPRIDTHRVAAVFRNTKCPVRFSAGRKTLGRKHLRRMARVFSTEELPVLRQLYIIVKSERRQTEGGHKECFSCPIESHQRKPATRRAGPA